MEALGTDARCTHATDIPTKQLIGGGLGLGRGSDVSYDGRPGGGYIGGVAEEISGGLVTHRGEKRMEENLRVAIPVTATVLDPGGSLNSANSSPLYDSDEKYLLGTADQKSDDGNAWGLR